MTPESFRSILVRLVVVPVAVMSCVIAILLLQINSLRESAIWVDHTNVAISEIGQLMNLLGQQESSLRAYILSADPQFLEPFNRAANQAPQAMKRIQDLTADNPVQQQAVAELRQSYDSWWKMAVERLKIGPTHGSVVPGAQMRKEQMDRLRALTQQMIDHEEGLRSARIQHTLFLLHQLFWVLGIAGTIAVLLIAWASITQMRSLSTAYERRLVEVQRQREWFNTTLRSIGDGVIACDDKGRVVFVNPVAEELTGWSDAEAIDKPVAQIFRALNEHTRTAIGDPMEAVRLIGTKPAPVNHAILIRRDGTEIPVANSGAPLRGNHGELNGAVFTFRDMTETRNAAEALRRAEKISVAGRLAASIAHEINNPLEALTNLLYLAASSSSLEEVREFITVGQEQLQRASTIVAQTLEFHRGSPNPSNCSMTELLDSVLSIWNRRFATRQIEIRREYANVPQFTAYVSELRQMITNLVANAYESMNAHGTMVLRTRVVDGGQQLRISVADTGSGIEPSVAHRIFEPFFTTKATGTGLGLWVTQEIVRKHGGTVRIRSRRTKPSGTVVCVFLPLQPETVTVEADLNQVAQS